MMIYDLTQGKHHQFFGDAKTLKKHFEDTVRKVSGPCISDFLFIRANKTYCSIAPLQLLFNTTPIFLVDTTMADSFVFVDECGFRIEVPEDKEFSFGAGEEFDIDKWVKSKERTSEKEDTPMTITDLMGVYIQDDVLVQKKIFIWLDKIENYAKKYSQNEEDIKGNAQALLDLVLFHELGHALMDVELYGEAPAPQFSYRHDYVYRFIEEAYANCIALTCLFWDVLEEERPNKDSYGFSFKGHFTSRKDSFIKDFVLGQRPGYSSGWELFEKYTCYSFGIEQWMCVKILFDYELACCLRDFWKNKDFEKIDYIRNVGRADWFLLKDHYNKYKVMDRNTRQRVNRFNRYDSFGPFNKEGLSIVKEDGLWGCIDVSGKELIPCIYDWIVGFEKGVSIAKKGKLYGAIDVHNQIVIPFKYSREEIERMLNR